MARATTLGNVTANIEEITPFAAFGANIRWLCGGYKKSTLFTFPVGQTTIGTNISFEPAVGCVSTKCTNICFRFVLHFIYLLTLIYPYAFICRNYKRSWFRIPFFSPKASSPSANSLLVILHRFSPPWCDLKDYILRPVSGSQI